MADIQISPRAAAKLRETGGVVTVNKVYGSG